MLSNIKKFSIKEMFNNDNGKTSGSGTVGLCLAGAGILGVLACIWGYLNEVAYTIEMMKQLVIVIIMAGALMGWRKHCEKEKTKTDNE